MMLDRTEERIVEWWIHKGWIERQYGVVYKTGLDVVFSFLYQLLCLLLIGGLLEDIILVLLLVACFVTVREYCGGYHAPTRILCLCVMVGSFLTVWAGTKLVFYWNLSWQAVTLSPLFHLAVFWWKAPASNSAKRVTENDIRKFRKISFAALLLWEMIAFALLFVNAWRAVQVSAILTVISVLVLPCRKGF